MSVVDLASVFHKGVNPIPSLSRPLLPHIPSPFCLLIINLKTDYVRFYAEPTEICMYIHFT